MATTIKSKMVSYGLVELREEIMYGTRNYVLYVNGRIKSQSTDLNYMIAEFDRLY
ncbi:MAG: hypothetical protein FWF10_10370 [Clostridiales bacterium]|nr:hypothetical protein [Clostridiales bacterium]